MQDYKNFANEVKEIMKDTTTKQDVINYPKHYNKGTIECRDIISEVIIGYGEQGAVDVSNIIKYIYRAPFKNGLQDLYKAQNYLNHLIERWEHNERK